jgi:protein-disulfide isomerase
MPKNRRLFLVLMAFVAAIGVRVAEAAAPAPLLLSTEDMSLGDPKAKVTVVEYGSASCPHCARFSNDVLPEFKKRYVDTGKVRYVFREFLTPPEEFAATGFMAARCAGPGKYFPFLEALYRAQASIYESGDLLGGLRKVAQDQGLSDKQFEDCVFDQKGLQALDKRTAKAEADGVAGTPTFIVGGKHLELDHEATLADLSAAIDPLLAKKN